MRTGKSRCQAIRHPVHPAPAAASGPTATCCRCPARSGAGPRQGGRRAALRGLVEERTVESTAEADAALNRSGATPTTDAASCCGSPRPDSKRSASRPTAPRWRPRGGDARRARTEDGSGRGRERPAGAPSAGQDPRGHQAGAARRHARPRRGATIAEIVAATGWQPHTVRGAFAGALKKRLGLTVESEKVEGRGRVYRTGT